MKSHFKNIDPNSKQLSRTLLQDPSDKFPNITKPIKITDSTKTSIQSLNSSAVKEQIYQKPSILPQINEKQKQNHHQIRKLLQQKSVHLKVAPSNHNIKTKFGWTSQSVSGSPQHKEPTHKRQNSNQSVQFPSTTDPTKNVEQFGVYTLNFNEPNQKGLENGQLARSLPSNKPSQFGQSSNSSYQNFAWNQPNQQMEYIEDEIPSEALTLNNLKTMKLMEADREMEMRKNEITSIGRIVPKIETDQNQNRLTQLEQNCPDRLEKVQQNNDTHKKSKPLSKTENKTQRNAHAQSNLLSTQPLTTLNDLSEKQNHPSETRQNDILTQTNNSELSKFSSSKPQSNVDIDISSEQNIDQKEKNLNDTVAKTILDTKSSGHKKQIVTQVPLDVQKKSYWLQTIDEIWTEFNKMSYDRAIFEKQIFLHIASTFSKFYMDKDQKMYLLDTVLKLVLVNSGWEKVEDELKFSGEMGLKLEKLANTIHFKHKQCLHNWQFIAPLVIKTNSDIKEENSDIQKMKADLKVTNFDIKAAKQKKTNTKGKHIQKEQEEIDESITFTSMKFDMDRKEIRSMAKKVEKLCVNNMDAFAFVSLYFQIAIDKMLLEKSFKQTQKHFIDCLEYLKYLYPASRGDAKEELNKTKPNKSQVKEEKKKESVDIQKENFLENFGIEAIKVDHEFDWVIFDKKSTSSNFDQLKEYIKNIAKQAEKDLLVYIDLVKQSCIEHGFGFKSDLKIKNNESQVFSIMRTIEKLLTSTFGKDLQKLKEDRMNRADDQLKYGTVKKFIEKEQIEVENDLKNILQQQDKIMFKAKDLVRGKCKFNTIEQIQATIRLLKDNIAKNADKGIKIIELENRLGNNTKDVVLLIKLPNTVAELQLALKLDSVLNEFNHKIYELRRSKIYACVSNLFIRGKKWAEGFFIEQLQIFKQMAMANPTEKYGEQICAQDINKKVFLFQENYLKAHDIKTTTDKLEQYDENRQIDDKLTMIEKGIKRGYHSLLDKRKRVDMQKENAVLFYLKNGKIKKAWEIVDGFSEEELAQNPIILRLKGDILREREDEGDQKKCIQCYERYVKLQENQNGETIEMANVLLMLAEIKLGNRNFKQAEIYFKRCARIRDKFFKKESVQYAMVLNRMGHLYRIQGKFQYSMRFYKRALQIIVMRSGKDSVGSAEVYCSLGNASFCCGQITQSQEYYEKSLQIYKKVKGSKSIEVSIIYNNMGNFYKQQLMFHEALDKYQKCLEIKEKIKGQTSLDVAYVYNNIGSLYRKFENFLKAEKFYNMSLMIKKKVKGQFSYHAASSYVDMGKFYTAKSVSKDQNDKDYDIAMSYFKGALKIKKQVFKNEQNLQIADIVSSIGSLYWTKKNQKALDYYFYSLQIMQKAKAKCTVEYSKVLINMGMVYQQKAKEYKEKGQREKAEQNQIQALKCYGKGATIEQSVRGDTADLAETNFTLSQLYLQMDVYERAYECADKAFLIWKKVWGDHHKYTKNACILRDKIQAIKNALKTSGR